MRMNVLITGITSFVGFYLADYILLKYHINKLHYFNLAPTSISNTWFDKNNLFPFLVSLPVNLRKFVYKIGGVSSK